MPANKVTYADYTPEQEIASALAQTIYDDAEFYPASAYEDRRDVYGPTARDNRVAAHVRAL